MWIGKMMMTGTKGMKRKLQKRSLIFYKVLKIFQDQIQGREFLKLMMSFFMMIKMVN